MQQKMLMIFLAILNVSSVIKSCKCMCVIKKNNLNRETAVDLLHIN